MAIVVKFHEIDRYWCLFFCHGGKTEQLVAGYPTKEKAVELANHIQKSAQKVIVSPSNAEINAAVKRAQAVIDKFDAQK